MDPSSKSSSPMTPKTPTSEVIPTGPAASPPQAQDVGSSRAAPFEAALRDPHLWCVVWSSYDGVREHREVVPVNEVLRNISLAHAADHLASFMAVRYARLVRNTEALP